MKTKEELIKERDELNAQIEAYDYEQARQEALNKNFNKLSDEFKKLCEHRFFRFRDANGGTAFFVTYAYIQKDVNIDGRLLYRIASITPSYCTDELDNGEYGDYIEKNRGGIVFDVNYDVFSSIEEFKEKCTEVSAADFLKDVVSETRYYLKEKFETYNGQEDE